jgi:3-carboxymethyl-3-hydroxy-acyl-[acp] synthase
MAVGIEAINAYVGQACVDVRDLFAHRGLDLSRFENLMMEQRSVNLPCEDAVTNAVNAAAPVVAALGPDGRDSIELLIVATESGVDLGKSLGTYVHQWLGLSRRCRSFEVKQACYAGTAALQSAAALVAATPVPGIRALVIATDSPGVAVAGSYVEPSEGAGAVAMLVSAQPDILQLDPGACGFHTFEVMDTLRPRPDVDIVDSDLSLLSYLTCLEQSFLGYRDRVAHADIRDTFDYLAFHTPFAGMVRGAHRMLLRKQTGLATDAIDADFGRRLAPSLAYPTQVGNLFSAALYLALCSLVDTAEFGRPKRIGLFSYGSGCASEFYSGVVPAGAKAVLARQRIGARVAERHKLSMAEYDTVNELNGLKAFGARDVVFDPAPYRSLYASHVTGRRLLVLDRIVDFHREYRWS